MKKNFKYAIMAAVLSMGMVSCSNNDDDAVDTDQPAESAEAYATISLKNNAVTRVPYFGATAEESHLETVKVYVFNSLKVLEDIVEFLPVDVAVKQKTFKTTAGTHYFLAVANYPQVIVPLGTGMDYLSQTLVNMNETNFFKFIDTSFPDGTNTGFFMTSGVYTDDQNGNRYYRSHDYAEADLIASVPRGDETNVPAQNKVTVYIGRAMAKVNLAILANSTTGVPTNSQFYGAEAFGTIDVLNTEYTVANNPDQMYYFPYFGTMERFQTPTYDVYNTTVAPTNYWPPLHKLEDATVVNPATSKYYYKGIAFNNTSNAVLNPFYVLENTNKLPTYGNATIISVKTQFTPDADGWEDTSIAPAAGTTFYRVYNKENKSFVYSAGKKGFWLTFTAADAAVGYFNTSIPNADCEVLTYTDAICYYIIPLKNKYRMGAPEWYDVVRNHFFDVVINKVNGCGYNVPGGNEETDEKDPLDPDVYMCEATIEVKPWVHVSQDEELGLRP